MLLLAGAMPEKSFVHDPKATMPTATFPTATFLQNAADVTGEFMLTKAAAAVAPALPAYCHDILQHVTDRKWDPSLRDKGCWVAPLKSLPECIALWASARR